MKLAFALRGHERNTLENKNLYYNLKKISEHYDTDIYIHTWNLNEARSSWRPVSKKRKEISQQQIIEYFSDLNVKKIIIENDEEIKLHGRVVGQMARLKKITCSEEKLRNLVLEELGDWSKNFTLRNLVKTISFSSNYDIFLEFGYPIIGWKRMWHGIYSVIKEIYESNIKYDAVINSRLDFLQLKNMPMYINNPDCPNINFNTIINLINSFTKKNSITFIKDTNSICIDNFYIGPIKQMFRLCEKFHYNLDDILEEHKVSEWTGNQEKLVFLQAEKLFATRL